MLRNITFLLFLFLVLHHHVLFVQSRHLRSALCKECSKTQENTMNIVEIGDHGTSDDEQGSRRVQFEVDDFRPTSPGHSPGVGHSIHN
ncbi:hypothetical protein VNO77_25315 [Canavalia gladiata]|uniref:Encoded peptide n=1 Tax=Canavalia gladiata TaxID=3824 RepID=A0AAN9QDD2_CANGL